MELTRIRSFDGFTFFWFDAQQKYTIPEACNSQEVSLVGDVVVNG